MTGDGSGVRLAVVLLGAARWPPWPSVDNTAFAASHDQFREFVRSDLRIPDSDVLDRFASPDEPGAQVDAIQDFLAQARERGVTDVLVYYVGHGDVSADNKYALLTTSASMKRPDSSVFYASFLAEAI